MVQVEVEYCGYCNFQRQCLELTEFLHQIPEVNIDCHSGRQGAFEVKINDKLVYSKLQSVAFPDYESVAQNVKNARDGKPMTSIQEQPIDNCMIM